MGTLHLLRDMTEADFDRVHAAHFTPARFAAAGPAPGIERTRMWLMPSVAHDDDTATSEVEAAGGSACHGGCVQGRMCDCVPAGEETKPTAADEPLPWLTFERFWTGFALLLVGIPALVWAWKSGLFA